MVYIHFSESFNTTKPLVKPYMYPGHFPFNKNSSLKFFNIHLPNKTVQNVHSCRTDPTQATMHLVMYYRVVTKISSCRVFVICSRGSRKQSWSPHHPPPPTVEVQLLWFSKRRYRPKTAIFIKSTAIISGYMMITSFLKKTTTFCDTKIISFYLKARRGVFLVAAKSEYTCKHWV